MKWFYLVMLPVLGFLLVTACGAPEPESDDFGDPAPVQQSLPNEPKTARPVEQMDIDGYAEVTQIEFKDGTRCVIWRGGEDAMVCDWSLTTP